MKTLTLICTLIAATSLTGCNGQTKGELYARNSASEKINPNKDTANKPQVKIKVNKQFDNMGNIIKYDSTYSYFYSGSGSSFYKTDADSIYNRFKNYFQKSYFDVFVPQQKEIFFNDSLFKYDFFNSDYFMKRYELNKKLFDEMYFRMDSLKQNFIENQYNDKRLSKKSITI